MQRHIAQIETHAIIGDVDVSNGVIKFASSLVPLIVGGSKTYTYRLGDKFLSLSPGQELLGADETGKVFGTLTILEKTISNFGSLPLRRPGHEPYFSRQHQVETFAAYYGRIPDEAETVTILRFALK